MCGNQVILSYLISECQWNVQILSVILCGAGWKDFPGEHTLNFSMVHFVCRVFSLESSVDEIRINSTNYTKLHSHCARLPCHVLPNMPAAGNVDNFLRIGPNWSTDQQLKKRRKKANKAYKKPAISLIQGTMEQAFKNKMNPGPGQTFKTRRSLASTADKQIGRAYKSVRP